MHILLFKLVSTKHKFCWHLICMDVKNKDSSFWKCGWVVFILESFHLSAVSPKEKNKSTKLCLFNKVWKICIPSKTLVDHVWISTKMPFSQLIGIPSIGILIWELIPHSVVLQNLDLFLSLSSALWVGFTCQPEHLTGFGPQRLLWLRYYSCMFLLESSLPSLY